MRFKPVFVDGSFKVTLDFESFNPPERQLMEPWLTWQAKTYKKLDKEGDRPDVWNALFGATNWVLEKLSSEQTLIFAKAFATMHRLIIERMPADGNRIQEASVLDDVGKLFCALVRDLNLTEALHEYSLRYIKMGDTSQIGKRPQDTAALTFMPDEMRKLIVVALLSKMLTPIFGTIMSLMPNVVGEDGRSQLPPDRELRCVVLMKPLLETNFKELMSKFQFYLRHTVNGCCQTDKAAAVFSGYTGSTRTDSIYANLLVRNFINIDLMYTDSNIMRFCDSIARTLVGTQDSASNKNQVKTRIPFGASSGEDAGNIAQMEVDSVQSSSTMDVPLLVAAAIPSTIRKYSLQYDITMGEFNSCLKHFAKNPVYPTPLNELMLCAFFGKDLGGGKGIRLLEAPNYNKLCCLLQMILFSQNLRDVGHMLTALPSAAARIVEKEEDILLKLNYCSSFSYKNVKQRIELSPASADGREWDEKVMTIVTDMLYKVYLFNTPPLIWDLLKSEDYNGKAIVNDVNIITGMCAFIEKTFPSLGD